MVSALPDFKTCPSGSQESIDQSHIIAGLRNKLACVGFNLQLTARQEHTNSPVESVYIATRPDILQPVFRTTLTISALTRHIEQCSIRKFASCRLSFPKATSHSYRRSICAVSNWPWVLRSNMTGVSETVREKKIHDGIPCD